MRKYFLNGFVVAILLICLNESCSSKGGGGGGGGGTTEANLAVTLNPPAGSTQPAAPGPDFPLTVSITSTLPSQGVTIDVSARQEGGTTNFFQQTASSSIANNNYNITSTPTGVVCVTTVVVTSKSKPTNTVTLSYRYSRKP